MEQIHQAVEHQRVELRQGMEAELASEKKLLADKFEAKIGDVVASYISESLGSGVDLGAQMQFILTSLEAHKEEIRKDLLNGESEIPTPRPSSAPPPRTAPSRLPPLGAAQNPRRPAAKPAPAAALAVTAKPAVAPAMTSSSRFTARIARIGTDIQVYLDWIRQNQIRKQVGAKAKDEPTHSAETVLVIEAWLAGKPATLESLEALLEHLRGLKLPEVHIMLAALPNRTQREPSSTGSATMPRPSCCCPSSPTATSAAALSCGRPTMSSITPGSSSWWPGAEN
jgi:hypothetical protein